MKKVYIVTVIHGTKGFKGDSLIETLLTTLPLQQAMPVFGYTTKEMVSMLRIRNQSGEAQRSSFPRKFLKSFFTLLNVFLVIYPFCYGVTALPNLLTEIAKNKI